MPFKTVFVNNYLLDECLKYLIWDFCRAFKINIRFQFFF